MKPYSFDSHIGGSFGNSMDDRIGNPLFQPLGESPPILPDAVWRINPILKHGDHP